MLRPEGNFCVLPVRIFVQILNKNQRFNYFAYDVFLGGQNVTFVSFSCPRISSLFPLSLHHILFFLTRISLHSKLCSIVNCRKSSCIAGAHSSCLMKCLSGIRALCPPSTEYQHLINAISILFFHRGLSMQALRTCFRSGSF